MMSAPWSFTRFQRDGFCDLLVVVFHTELTEASMTMFLHALNDAVDWEGTVSRGVRLGLLIDTSKLGSPPAVTALQVRDFMSRNRENFARCSTCTVIMVRSRVVRFLLRGVFMVQEPARPVEVCSSVSHGLELLSLRYNVVMPDIEALDRLGVKLSDDGVASENEHFEQASDATA